LAQQVVTKGEDVAGVNQDLRRAGLVNGTEQPSHRFAHQGGHVARGELASEYRRHLDQPPGRMAERAHMTCDDGLECRGYVSSGQLGHSAAHMEALAVAQRVEQLHKVEGVARGLVDESRQVWVRSGTEHVRGDRRGSLPRQRSDLYHHPPRAADPLSERLNLRAGRVRASS
jgi:hypothetical protein